MNAVAEVIHRLNDRARRWRGQRGEKREGPAPLGRKIFRRIAACAACAALCAAGRAEASSTQPTGINLGGSSFNDGFGRVTPGFVYQQYLNIEEYGAINDANGKKIGPPVFNNQHIGAVVSLNQFLYISPFHLFGGALGGNVVLPLVWLSAHNDAPANVSLKANGFGLGDLTFGPFLQMPPVIRNGRPVFSQRFEFDIIAPSGDYSRRKDINQSSGFWSLNPFWAFTVLPVPNFEISSRLNMLYNFTNYAPAGSGPAAGLPDRYQAGQAIWDNFAASYTVAPGLDVGVNGYYFRQITQDKTDGVTQSGSETTNLAIGPGLTYALSRNDSFFANAYLPIIEKNTTDGFHLVFHWIHVF